MTEYTKDTIEQIEDGDGVYYNEATGDYFATWLGMINSGLESGMSEDEVINALNLEDDDESNGYMYYTEYSS